MRSAATMFGAALLVACSPSAMPLPADHPANPAAPRGRLAGAPPALGAGVAADALVEPIPRVTPARASVAAEPTATEPADAPPTKAPERPAKKKPPKKKPADQPPADQPVTGHEHHHGGAR